MQDEEGVDDLDNQMKEVDVDDDDVEWFCKEVG